MIDVKTYPVAHGKEGGSGGGGVTYIAGNVTNSDLPDNINVTSINAANGNIDYLTGKSMTFNDAQFLYLASENGVISKLSGDDLNYMNGVISNLTSDTITTGKIKATEADIEKAWIETLNSKNITTEYLTVTKQAHFFELVIDKIKSVGGTIIETAANCVTDYVKAYDSSNNEVALDANNVAYWDIFFRTSDGSGRMITNDWEVNDQAICQSFSNVSTGVNYDVSNKYYWMLVTQILSDRYMNLNTGAETNNSAQASVNSVQITNPTLTYTVYDSQGNPSDDTVTTGWTIQAQTIPGVITGATWDSSTNTMTTTNTVFGIQMTTTSDVVPTKFSFDCSSARLNVGVYYIDSSSQWFPASDTAKTSYEINLSADNSVEAIVITNADEVEWHQVHGIRLSNTVKDAGIAGYESIPSKGDHIAQLGYRYPANPTDDQRARSSAIIIAAYKTPDSGIKPPSYAQYRNITDFNLTSHRQTYFDANGAKFVGDFEIAGQDIQTYIDGQISSSAPTYYMYTAYCDFVDGDPTHKDPALYPNNVIHFSLSYDQNQAYMGIWSTTVSPQPTNPDSAVNYEWMYIQGSQGQQGPAGPTGAPGSHIEFAYQNATNNPLPNGATTQLNTYPSGFATAVTSPPTGQATWMTQSEWGLVGATYLTWTPSIRITGDKGNPGEDGTEIEFIYTRNNGGISGSPNPPASPPSTFDPGPTGATYNGVYWTNHPVGVAEATMYEYVCQRIKGPTGVWGAYQPSPAAVWSKWGEKGQDGDGYEYIYQVNDSATAVLPYPADITTPNATESKSPTKAGDGFVPAGWHDEPQTITEDLKFEWVSMRRKYDHGGATGVAWDPFSTPQIWAHWSAPGAVGPEGPQGPTGATGAAGENAIQYILLDQGSQAKVIAELDNNNNMTEKMYIDLRYKVVKIEGATATIMSYNDLIDFNNGNGTTGMYPYVRFSPSTSGSSNYVYWRMTLSDNNGDGYYTWSGPWNMTPPITSQKVIEDNPALTIQLLKYNAGLDSQGRTNTIAQTSSNLRYSCATQTITITMAPNATFQVLQGQNASISSLVSGQNGLSQEISQIRQDQSSISSTVSSHTTQINTLSGQVQNQNTQISQIQQTANSISSTVSNLKNGSQNLFNFTCCNFQNCVPFIQGYGVECYGTGEPSGRIANLGFDGINGDYSMSCYMKLYSGSQERNIRVDINDTDEQVVTVNSNDWTFVQMTFHNVKMTSSNADTQAMYEAGFIDFHCLTGSLSSNQRLYIRNLMIVRGNLPNVFSISAKDYDKAKASTDILIGPSDWTYDNKLTKTTDKFKGFDVYHINAGNNSGNGYYINSGLYRDMIWLNDVTVKRGVYTLSLYAKSSGDTTFDNVAYMYNNGSIVDGKIGIISQPSFNSNDFDAKTSVGNMTDGQTNYKMQSGTWHRYIIHWYNNSVGTVNRNVIALRFVNNTGSNNYNKAIDIAGVELREGYFDESMISTASMIQQTADEITLKVNETGINITDGTITLNADNTVIDGDLMLMNDQGVKLYDSNKYEKISITPESLGNLENYNFSTPKTTTFTAQPTAANSVTFTNLANPGSAGRVNPGERIIIDSIKVYPYRNVPLNPVSPISGTQISYYYEIKNGANNELIKRYPNSGTATATRMNTQYKYQLEGYNEIYTGSSVCTPMLNIYITGTFPVNEWRADIDFTTQASGLNKIAFDGAVFASSNTAYNWMGPDRTVIRRNNQQLEVNDNYILHNNFPIASYVSVTAVNSSSYTAKQTDEFIYITYNGNTTINLPKANDNIGKIYYFKRTGNDYNVTLSCTSANGGILDRDSISRVQSKRIDKVMTIAISAGGSWNLLY